MNCNCNDSFFQGYSQVNDQNYTQRERNCQCNRQCNNQCNNQSSRQCNNQYNNQSSRQCNNQYSNQSNSQYNNQSGRQCSNQCDSQRNCQCNWQCGCQFGRPCPIIAPRRVCTTFRNQFVEQPVICPIECRRVNNVVYVPRYYPQYEQTCFSQNNTMSM